MGVLISGLDKEACAALFAAHWPSQQLQWTAPEAFLRQAETLESRWDSTASESGASDPLVWLYQAPWALRVPDQPGREHNAVALGLVHWYRQQRAALALRRTLGNRMLLVNADRVRGEELAAHLGLTSGSDRTAGSLGAYAGASAGRRPLEDPVGQGLAKLFEWSLSHYWDLFEDLEATAWLPAGEPFFRRDLQPVTVEGIEQLLLQLQQGLSAPQWGSELDQSRQVATRLQQRLRETETALEHERDAHAEMREHLTRRVAELEEQVNQREAAQAASTAECDALQTALADERARVLDLEQASAQTHGELEQVRRDLKETQAAKVALETAQQTETAAATARAQALTEDNERVKAELHELRDAHEGQIVANRELRSRLARSTETLDRARVQLCRQLARGGLT